MPVREWLRHATSASDDHAPGTFQRALQYNFEVQSYTAQEPPIAPRALQKRAGREREAARCAVYCSHLACSAARHYGRASGCADRPPPGNRAGEPPPTPVPGPLETLPSPHERLLAPVPTQFNWLQREVPSNPFLEALLSVYGRTRFIVSTSLREEISDNFEQNSSGRGSMLVQW